MLPVGQILLMPAQVPALSIGRKHGGVVQGVVDEVGVIHARALPEEGALQRQVGATHSWVYHTMVPASRHGSAWRKGRGWKMEEKSKKVEMWISVKRIKRRKKKRIISCVRKVEIRRKE